MSDAEFNHKLELARNSEVAIALRDLSSDTTFNNTLDNCKNCDTRHTSTNKTE